MTVIELTRECERVLAAGLYRVALVLPRSPGRGRRMRIGGPGSPLGEIACCSSAGTVCYFGAIDVLAWLTLRGLIQAEIAETSPSVEGAP
jgi:hypothetical protein